RLPAAANRWCRPRIIGLCRARCASCNGCSARRRWKPRSSRRRSNTPRGQKNGRGWRRRRRRTVPDDDRGRGDWGLPLQSDGMHARAAEETDGPPLPDDKLVAEIKAVIVELPTYRRVHAILKRQALAAGLKPPNHKRVYRVMKVHGLLRDRHAGGAERRHDGRIAVDERNRRWCSDGFEIGCDNGERVRVTFVLDCCDREAISFLATTGGISGDDVRDLMVTAVEHRFGRVNRLPATIEAVRQR